MIVVAVVVEAEQDVGFISGAQDLAGTDPDLKDGGTTGNGGGDGHEGHDLLFAPASQAGEKAADGLDAILGIAGDADENANGEASGQAAIDALFDPDKSA